MDQNNPHRRKPRICEICGETYTPTYSRQRSCSRQCGLRVRFGERLYSKTQEPNLTDANMATTRERTWLQDRRYERLLERYRVTMLERYHSDPKNWSTVKKRTRLFNSSRKRQEARGLMKTWRPSATPATSRTA